MKIRDYKVVEQASEENLGRVVREMESSGWKKMEGPSFKFDQGVVTYLQSMILIEVAAS